MAEYKGKLLKGLIQAKNVLLSNGSNVDDLLVNQPEYAEIGNIIAEVKNGVLIIDFSNIQGATANAWNSKGLLPVGYRPNRNVYSSATEIGGTTALIYVSSAGEIQIRPKMANTGYYGQIVCGV